MAAAGLVAGLLVASCGRTATEQPALSPGASGEEVPSSGPPDSHEPPRIASTVAPRISEHERAALPTQPAVDVVVRSSGAPVEGVDVMLVVLDDRWVALDMGFTLRDPMDDPLVVRSIDHREKTSWPSPRRVTDERGHVRIEIPASLRGARRFVALADAPLLGDARAEAARFPTEPLELELPPFGELEVRVRAADPELLFRASSVHAVLVDSPGFELASLIEFGAAAEGPGLEWREVTERRAVLSCVPLWTRLRLRAEDGVGRACSLEREVDGPSTAGQRVVVGLDLVPPPLVSGRAVDESGAPLRRTSLQCSMEGDTRPYVAERFRVEPGVTDTEGRFELALFPTHDQVGGELVLLAGTPSYPSGKATLKIPPVAGLGARLELGDVVFPSEPLAVAGRVLDEDGNPAKRARLRVFERTDSPRLVLIAPDVRVDPFGRFSFHAHTDATELLVEARVPGREPVRALHVPVGTDDLELSIPPLAARR